MTDRGYVGDKCDECKRVVELYRKHSSQPNAYVVHVECSLIEPIRNGGKVKNPVKKESDTTEEKKRKKNEKKILLDQLSAIACALRNTNGGSILVHLCGQQKENRYLGFFDEFATDSLTYLIEDGKLYVDTYRRFWLDSLRAFKDVEGFVCINVEKSSGLSIVSFCTKVRNDFEILKPSPLNILTLLKSLPSSTDGLNATELKRPAEIGVTNIRKSTNDNELIEKAEGNLQAPIDRTSTDDETSTADNKAEDDSKAADDRTLTETETPKVRGKEESDLQECRNVEFKSVSRCAKITKHTKVSEFVNFVWNDLKLKENIVSMSKIDDGGSFYVGIAEKKEQGRFCTVKPILEGFETYARPDKYIKEIQSKLSSEVLVLHPDFTFGGAPDDLITVTFHNHQSRKFILEVSIRKFHGIVFSHREGPLAYIIKGREVKRMSKEEILTKTLKVYKIPTYHLPSK